MGYLALLIVVLLGVGWFYYGTNRDDKTTEENTKQPGSIVDVLDEAETAKAQLEGRVNYEQ